jgi:DNA invertase Pin-like site-specific DNA recombinase
MAARKKSNRPSVAKMKRLAKIRVCTELMLTGFYSVEDMSELFHVHVATVYRWLASKESARIRCLNGYRDDYYEPQGKTDNPFDDEQYVKNLHEDGKPLSVILNAVHIKKRTVLRWISELERDYRNEKSEQEKQRESQAGYQHCAWRNNQYAQDGESWTIAQYHSWPS